MSEHEPMIDTPAEAVAEAAPQTADVSPEVVAATEPVVEPKVVNPVRSAAGRAGAKRVQELARLGREYEREHGLKPGRQRRRQLIALGRRYEVEHGLAAPKPRKRKRGDAWTEFLAALARVVKPTYRPAVEQMVAALRQPKVVPQPQIAA